MILKKPYAFLIKYFKVIHGILAILYIYLAFKTSSLLNYYNAFISRTVGSSNAINYISKFPFFIIILTFIICIILYILMNYKKKPKTLYALLVLIYIAVFVVISMSYKGLEIIYSNVLESKTTLLYRDLLRITLIFQYISIVFITIRAIGFDIKKFNFSEDIHTLDIDINDDEEVELVMGVDKHKITQKINRKTREFKYYLEENKLFVSIMVAVLIILGLSTITIDKKIINKEYKEGETFSSDSFNMNITNSYISKKTYDGTTLSDNNSYLILKLSINPIKLEKKLNTAQMILQISDKEYKINKKYGKLFKDIGIGYENQVISGAKNYIMIYEIPDEEIKKDMYILYSGSAKATKIKLSPIELDVEKTEKEFKLTESLVFSDAILNGSSIKINTYEISQKFPITYTYEIDGKTYEGKKNISSVNNTLLKLEIDSAIKSSISIKELLLEYTKVKYSKDNNEIETNFINDKTPSNNNRVLYLEITKNIENADKIWLETSIRNMKYKYILK